MLLPLVVLILSVVALAVPSRRANHAVHEKRAAEPVGWEKARRLESHKILPVRIGLKQRNLHLLSDLLDSVAHPESPSYGQHWSAAEVADYFAPSDATIQTVKEWLTDTGFAPERVRVSHSKGWIEVNATVAETENLLNTEYHVYAHPSGVEQISCSSYSVPNHVRDHVELIKPTVHFNHRAGSLPSKFSKRKEGRLGLPTSDNGPKTNGVTVKVPPTLENCDQFITPDCLRALYNINYKPVATSKNSYGIGEFHIKFYMSSSLTTLHQSNSRHKPSSLEILIYSSRVVQTTNQSFDFNGESDLDLEYAMTLVNPQKITLLQAGDLPEGASFDNWLDAVDKSFCTFEGGDDPTQDGIYPDPLPGGFDQPESCGIIKAPNVVSVSYGQDESTVTAAYANRQCSEYGKLGLLGTSVLYSSGDFGVAGFGGVCLDASGNPVDNGTKFNPDFPVGCPFVTAVGATQINPGSTVRDPESACEQVIFSGGGFSNIFPIPSYQKDVVTSFLKTHPPPYTAEQFNNSGKVRAFPDLSANGANYVIGIDGEFELVFGTSASSPVVGSMITLINDARLAIGKGPVGFLNPAIYSDIFRLGFHDITTGGNQGCSKHTISSTFIVHSNALVLLDTPGFTS
ncbi:hypothetical protein FA95DRAFT_1562476 [Auriscalpium vulgare]|uniref:Uncharacterized protein n=1 Tax=Auriscalpium vulgare TaxID=40419 RepID=A0ACB8RJU0_9AGAM|nr:hypothetical protein FA95DRAFT_1562476 [Auriscalpium vulgare]